MLRSNPLKIEETRLQNGLTVLLARNSRFPIASVTVGYQVGSVDEAPGRTGFAHLFEHLMFQGSENVPRNGHFQMVAAAGGELNAFTTRERTVYFEALPSGSLELGLWLEADRMRSLALTLENFETERSTVKEERRQRVDNRPYAPASLLLEKSAYPTDDYRHSVIGEMRDLDRASLDDVTAFFRSYYHPRNAVLVLDGDFSKARALRLVKKHFGAIPSRKRPRRARRRSWPRRMQARRFRRSDPLAATPAILMAVAAPPATHQDFAAAKILTGLLVDGQASRLHRRLVKEDRLAIGIQAHMDSHQGAALFLLSIVAKPSCERACICAIQDEFDKLVAGGPRDDELERAKNRATATYLDSVASTLQRGVAIATATMIHGDADAVNRTLSQLLAVSAADVRRVSGKMLSSKTIVTVTPKSGGRAKRSGREN